MTRTSDVAFAARRVRRPLLLWAAAALLIVAAASWNARSRAASTWLVSFTIDGTYSDGLRVISDLVGPYMDYRLEPEPGPSACIEAALSPTGSLHAVLNRKIDGAGTRCNPLGSDRQFKLSINAPSACNRIGGAYGSAAVSMNPDGTCELLYNDNPRVRVEPFAKTSRTNVAFLTEMFGSTRSYEIRTLTEATILPGIDSNQRVVTYYGDARLVEFAPGVKAQAVADPFDLDLRITFNRSQ